MRFTIDTQELNSGINTVIKAIGNRTTISILEGIYLSAMEMASSCSPFALHWAVSQASAADSISEHNSSISGPWS